MGPLSFVEHSETFNILISKGIDPTTSDCSSASGEEYELTVNQHNNQQQPQSTTMTERKTDKYGFILNMDASGNLVDGLDDDDYDTKTKVPSFFETKRTERRVKKWDKTMESWERRRPNLMKKRLRKGLPEKVRGRVWLLLGGGIRQPGLYQEIVQKTSDAMISDYKEIAAREIEAKSKRSTQPSNSNSTTATNGDDSKSSSSPGNSERKNGSTNDELVNGSNNKKVKSQEGLDYANTQLFRSIQDTIERDIHRTYPRHTLFYEEDRTGESNGETQPNPGWIGMCDPELAILVQNLESDLKTTVSGQAKRKVTSSKPDEGANGTPAGQAALRRVLRAYSYYDRDVGYCQGMNFIAGMFLTIMTEEEAFWVLVGTMHDKPCEMRGLFGEGMKETHKVLHVAERLTHHYLPKLAKHFDKEHLHVTMYATQWLMTQYTSSFKFDLVFRVWDCFLGEGWKIIYRVMLALLSQWQSQLLKMNFEEILTFFRELPDRVDGNAVLDRAIKIKLRTRVINKYAKEWDAKQQQQQQTGGSR